MSLHLDCPKPDLKWSEIVDYLRHPNTEVTVALVENISNCIVPTSASWRR